MDEFNPRLSIVIPAYNEADRLPATLTKINAFLSEQPDLAPAEILVIDDGSVDDTADLARAHPSPTQIRVRVLVHERNRGKGAAVRTGFSASCGRQVLLSDADLATPIEEIHTLLAHSGDDRVVIGSRAVNRQLILTRQPMLRDMMGRIFNLMVQLLVLPGVWDSQCGFKLFSGTVARRLAAAQRINGFAFDVELLARARADGLTLCEVGVQWRHVAASRVMPGRHSLQMFRDLVRIACWRITGRLQGSGKR